jgi:4-hydroxy-3-polyprenylbenzoate decarboxylase
MAYFKDLREFLAALEKQGALRRISAPIDKDRELHPLVRWQYRGIDEPERAGFLFENVVDRQGRRFRGQVATSVWRPIEISMRWRWAASLTKFTGAGPKR